MSGHRTSPCRARRTRSTAPSAWRPSALRGAHPAGLPRRRVVVRLEVAEFSAGNLGRRQLHDAAAVRVHPVDRPRRELERAVRAGGPAGREGDLRAVRRPGGVLLERAGEPGRIRDVGQRLRRDVVDVDVGRRDVDSVAARLEVQPRRDRDLGPVRRPVVRVDVPGEVVCGSPGSSASPPPSGSIVSSANSRPRWGRCRRSSSRPASSPTTGSTSPSRQQ